MSDYLTPEEIVAAVARLTFGYPFLAWGLEVSAIHDHRDPTRVTIAVSMLKTPHRDTGLPIRVYMRETLPPFYVIDVQRLMHWVYELVLKLLRHELDESLHLDGRRMFNPHEKDQA